MISLLELLINDVDKIIVKVHEKAIPKEAILNEGKWVPSGTKDWMIRVDPPNPAISVQRHVHIARSKHVSAKNMQASWNQDQTRHDKGSFNPSIGSLYVVKKIAKHALGLPDDALLEHVENNRSVLLENNDSGDVNRIVCLELVLQVNIA